MTHSSILDRIGETPKQALWRRAKAHRGFQIGCLIFFSIVLAALAAPLLTSFSPYEQSLAHRLIPPVWMEGGSWQYLLGTDYNGRDYLARLLYGARISLIIGIGAATVGCIIGVFLGVMAGYLGGRVDQIVQYLLTCQLALPGLLLAMTVVFFIGPSVTVVICVIGVLHWTLYLVVTRSATQKIRQLDYINAAQAIGSSRARIVWQDIIPNLFNHIIVIFTLEVGIAILSEASLSFLGVGIQPPTPSWGLLIAEGKTAMFFQPWLVVLPGAALFFLVVSINLIGDGLRDITATDTTN